MRITFEYANKNIMLYAQSATAQLINTQQPANQQPETARNRRLKKTTQKNDSQNYARFWRRNRRNTFGIFYPPFPMRGRTFRCAHTRNEHIHNHHQSGNKWLWPLCLIKPLTDDDKERLFQNRACRSGWRMWPLLSGLCSWPYRRTRQDRRFSPVDRKV